MKLQKCLECETEFKSYPSQNRSYCSRKCMKIGYSKRLTGTNNPNYRHGPKYCLICNNPVSRNAKENYCIAHFPKSGKDNPFYGKKHSHKTRKNMVKNHYNCKGQNGSFYGHHHTVKNKINQSNRMKNRWVSASPSKKKQIIKQLLKGLATQRSYVMTKPEKIIAHQLNLLNVKYTHNAPLYNKFLVDFLLENGLIIEVFGDYWHGNPLIFKMLNNTQVKQQNKDKSRLSYLKSCGRKVLVFWENDIKSNIDLIVDIIKAEI